MALDPDNHISLLCGVSGIFCVIMRNVRTLLQPSLSNGQTVVEHSPRHPNVKGLSLVDATATVGKKWPKKCLLVRRAKAVQASS
jgi:hypothetical protein